MNRKNYPLTRGKKQPHFWKNLTGALFAAYMLLFAASATGQTSMIFGSDFASGPSYTFSTTDIAYANATGSSFSTSSSNLCNGASKRTQVTTIILKLVSTTASVIKVEGTSSGTARTLTNFETATAINGTYTAVSGYSSASTISSSSCGEISVTGLNLATNTFVRMTFSGNVNVSGFIVTSAGSAPTVTTTTVSSVTGTGASGGGNVTADGGVSVTARGIKYGTSSPAAATATTDGTGTGIFTSSLASLTENTKYYYRAYATNTIGTSYGTEYNFTTLPATPSISGTNNSNAQSSANSIGFTAS